MTVPTNTVDVNDLTLYDWLPDGFTVTGTPTVSCDGACTTTPMVYDHFFAAGTDIVPGSTRIAVGLGDIPASTAPSQYTITIPAQLERTFANGEEIIAGARAPLTNTARLYFNLGTNAPDPAPGTPAPLEPNAQWERRTITATAAFEVITPRIEVDKIIADRTPHTWQGPSAPDNPDNLYPVNPGERLEWELTITNTGNAPAVDVIITDDLGSGHLGDVAYELPAGITAVPQGDGTVRFTLADPLAPSELVVLRYAATLPASADLPVGHGNGAGAPGCGVRMHHAGRTGPRGAGAGVVRELFHRSLPDRHPNPERYPRVRF